MLVPDLTIPPRSRGALQKAADKGVLVTLATGRMFRSVLPYARELGIAAPLIAYNGALIEHPQTGEILFHEQIPFEHAKRVAAICRENDLHLNVYINDILYVERLRPEAEYYRRISGVESEVVGDLVKFLQNMEKSGSSAAGGGNGAGKSDKVPGGKLSPTKLLVVVAPEASQKWLSLFRGQFPGILHVTGSKPEFVEMMVDGVSKGRALAFLARRLGIEPADVMAIGDGYNDLEMLQFAGVSVAMGNAPAVLKAQATYVTRPNTEEGVAEAIERFVL